MTIMSTASNAGASAISFSFFICHSFLSQKCRTRRGAKPLSREGVARLAPLMEARSTPHH